MRSINPRHSSPAHSAWTRLARAPPPPPSFIGSAGISGTSEMCIQIRYLKDLWSVQFLCSSVFLSTFEFPACRASCPAFKLSLPPSVSFLKFWSQEEFSFPWRNNPDFLAWFYFSLLAYLKMYWLQWWLAPLSFLPLGGTGLRSDLSVTEHVCCTAALAALVKFLIHVA